MNPIASPLARVFLAAMLVAPAANAFAFVEGLPPEVPREGVVITIDVSTNTAWLFRDGEVVASSGVATGSDKILRSGHRVWFFRTPRGRLTVQGKIANPVWTKPDWAFIEEGKRVPPPASPSRRVPGKLGQYALDLGGGILIHGTDDPKSIGRRVSHGCIRMPAKMLERVYREVSIGTDVYIFESDPQPLSLTGLNSLDMR
ncbi:MAG TPA: L,D-transpeptidase [Thermoanaerobaculia bacterium]|nr:L,D-transpeptidase [Thermoanaerobaculia bacterium]